MNQNRFFLEKSAIPMSEFNKGWPAVEVELIFGVRSLDCSGNGICRLYPPQKMGKEKAYIHFARACFYKLPPGKVLIIFDAMSMRRNTIERHFSDGVFRVDETVNVPPFIYQKLGLPNLKIIEGEYKVVPIYRYYFMLLEEENLNTE